MNLSNFGDQDSKLEADSAGCCVTPEQRGKERLTTQSVMDHTGLDSSWLGSHLSPYTYRELSGVVPATVVWPWAQRAVVQKVIIGDVGPWHPILQERDVHLCMC